ncbi:MAG: N5-glutamine methyltransferase family protein [Acidimicrobiales bacterium]
MSAGTDLDATAAELRRAGCVAAEEEAAELVAVAGGDSARLRRLVGRRCEGEPLAWLTSSVCFCGETVLVHPGVYVPRWQSEPLAREALARLPEHGSAVDLCTGAGAIAVVLARRRPSARVAATEIDPLAVACARANGVEVFQVEVLQADMAACLPEALNGRVDVVTAVVPYVPTGELRLLPRDVLAYEPVRALDGGEDGARHLIRAAVEAASLLRPGGSLLLELGGDQADLLRPVLAENGYSGVELLADEDHDVRALLCRH